MDNQRQAEQKRVTLVISLIKQKLAAVNAELNKAHFERTAVEKNYGQNAKINTFEVDDQMETNAEVQQQKQLVAKNLQTENILQRQVKSLKNLSHSPYFGRIDIQEKGEPQKETLYIGISSFVDTANNFWVYDWRAPISSIYYNGVLGPVSYQTPLGIQQVELLKKRQFKIIDGKIQNMFDTNETVGDALLQDLLSEHSDKYMHNIVATIQQEQNSIIRDTSHDLLLVQGVAGSGKTSAVLQRVAFLLYHSRQHLAADQLVLFSPNELFSNYVSEVLPSLGEKNMRQVTLQEFFSHRFEGLQIENLFETFEKSLQSPDSSQNQESIKDQAAFIDYTMAYANDLTSDQLCFTALSLNGKTIIPARQIHEIYQKLPTSWRPALKFNALKKQLVCLLKKLSQLQLKKDWVTNQLQELSDEQIRSFSSNILPNLAKIELELRKKIVEKHYLPIYEAIYNDYFIDIYQQYGDFLLQIDLQEAKKFADQLEYHRIAWRNCAPLLMLRDILTGSGVNHQIKYVFIDEMQDYSTAQLLYLKHAFPKARFTLLGDSQQALYAAAKTAKTALNDLKKDLHFKNAKLVELNKSYRSTFEITDFIKQILPDGQQILPFSRHGKRPQIFETTEADWSEQLLALIQKLAFQGQTIALITQTQVTAKKLAFDLKKHLDVKLIEDKTSKLSAGVIVLPLYLAKGLEFDSVIVFNASQTAYPAAKWSLLYTACSRAMHQLILFSIGQHSRIIDQIQTNKYSLTQPPLSQKNFLN
jgi:DNA helicase IV